MQQANSVRIRTNESNLIARLGTVFSSSDKALSEMMQNARRARASEIRFSYEGGSLTVIDNYRDRRHAKAVDDCRVRLGQ